MVLCCRSIVSCFPQYDTSTRTAGQELEQDTRIAPHPPRIGPRCGSEGLDTDNANFFIVVFAQVEERIDGRVLEVLELCKALVDEGAEEGLGLVGRGGRGGQGDEQGVEFSALRGRSAEKQRGGAAYGVFGGVGSDGRGEQLLCLEQRWIWHGATKSAKWKTRCGREDEEPRRRWRRRRRQQLHSAECVTIYMHIPLLLEPVVDAHKPSVRQHTREPALHLALLDAAVVVYKLADTSGDDDAGLVDERLAVVGRGGEREVDGVAGPGGSERAAGDDLEVVRLDLHTVSAVCCACTPLTRFTIRRRLPLNTSSFSTHRFHAHSAVCSTQYPTTAAHSTGLLSSKLTRSEYATDESASTTDA